jgi:hypothetical protein
MRRSAKIAVAGLLWLASPVFAGMAEVQTEQRKLELGVGIYRIEAECAETPESRSKGLMDRYSLPADKGMLFIFPKARHHCMWMHNTHIPLSAAFLDDEGTVINISDMQPDTNDYHCAVKPVRFVLEMNSGWFAKRGVRPGTRIDGIVQSPKGY